MCEPVHHYTVRKFRGRPTLFDQDSPRPLVMYMPGDAWGNVAKRDVDDFLEAGVRDFYLWVGRAEDEDDMYTTPFWPGPGSLGEPQTLSSERFFSLPERVEYIVKRSPDARFLLRYFAHPPKAWKDAHPEEMALDASGKRLDETSLASARYEKDHRRFLLHMIKWIESQPWAWRVIGYISLHEYEGTTLNALEGRLFDYSEPMQLAFRAFAPRWDSVPQERFVDERISGLGKNWQEPSKTEKERQYFELLRRLFFRRSEIFVEAVLEAVGDRKVLIGWDSLKQGMQGWLAFPFFKGKAPRLHHSHVLLASGSIGVDEIFKIPEFNILATPYDYTFRHMGGVPEPEGMVDTCVLRGKIFFAEDDCRSFVASENESFGYFRNETEAKAGLWRNAAAAIARGYQAYWMDVTSFPSPRGGFFRNPNIMETIKSIVPVIRKSMQWEHVDVPGIAVVLDDRAALFEDFSADYQNLAVMWQRLTGLAHCGVPYRVYLWEDLEAENFPDHRLFVFPNLFRMNQERLDILKERVCCKNRVVLWGPGTGITDGCELSSKWASIVTEMPMTLLDEVYSRRVVLTRFDHPITSRLKGSISYGDSMCYGPILLPECDPSISEQGIVVSTRGVNRPGLAVKEIGVGDRRWTSVFTAAVPVPSDLLREMARHAGAHVYSEENDVILASKHFLGVHSVRVGRRTIKLPSPSHLWDAVSGELLGERAEIDFVVSGPETRLFCVNSDPTAA